MKHLQKLKLVAQQQRLLLTKVEQRRAKLTGKLEEQLAFSLSGIEWVKSESPSCSTEFNRPFIHHISSPCVQERSRDTGVLVAGNQLDGLGFLLHHLAQLALARVVLDRL